MARTKIRPVEEKRDFFDDEGLSDVIIKFGDKQVFAHKVILAKGSVWFEKAFMGGFCEANKEVIELHDNDNSEAIIPMLRHLYGMTYGDQDLDEEHAHTIAIHLSVFMLGDKYDISSLRIAAAERFRDFLDEETDGGPYYDETIYAIQKLLGPNAPQLADETLICSANEFVFDNYEDCFHNTIFRGLLAEGAMLQKDLAVKFLNKVKEHI